MGLPARPPKHEVEKSHFEITVKRFELDRMCVNGIELCADYRNGPSTAPSNWPRGRKVFKFQPYGWNRRKCQENTVICEYIGWL